MDLFEEINGDQIIGKKKKNNQTKKIIIAVIVILLVIIIGIFGTMMYLKSLSTKFYVDGVKKDLNDSYFQFTDDGKIYISIYDIAQLLGINYYNGEYGKISEDTSTGYVAFSDEVVTFSANSNKIYKIDTSSNEETYSYMYLDEEVKYSNRKLYTTPDGIQKILNIGFNYNKDINIYSLDYLETAYTEKIASYGYKSLSDEFKNKKALKNDILVVEKEDGKKGVIKSDGSEIVGPKYDEISYLENTGDFMVTSANKVGIINSQGKSKISLDYDEIKILDEDLGLYIVKQNEKYGVLNQSGSVVIYIENDDIGIDTSLYKDSNIKNKYLLYENCIPVKKDEKWGIYNKNGKLILPIEYDSIGCVVGTASTKSAGNVVTIDDYEAIVIGKDKHYGIINSTGATLIPCALDTVYSITSSGKTTYKIEGTQNGSAYSYDLEKYFDAMNIKKVNRNSSEKETENIEDISSNTTNNTTGNTSNTTTNNAADSSEQTDEETNEENDEDVEESNNEESSNNDGFQDVEE